MPQNFITLKLDGEACQWSIGKGSACQCREHGLGRFVHYCSGHQSQREGVRYCGARTLGARTLGAWSGPKGLAWRGGLMSH